MSDELKTLWQSQPTLPLPPQRGEGQGAGPDLAVPTSHFAWKVERRAPRPVSRTVLVALAACLALLAVAGLFFAWGQLRARAVVEGRQPAPSLSPEDEVEQLLAECRTFSDAEAGPPDWARAEAACTRALELAPAHPEVTALVRRISTLRACESNFDAAVSAESVGEPVRAAVAWSRLSKDCETYLVRAMPHARAVLPQALERAAVACAGGDDALCRAEAQLECQRGALEGNPHFAAFLAKHPDFRCADWPAFRAEPAKVDRAAVARELVRGRFADPLVAEAVVRYFDGDLLGARGSLAAVLNDPAHASAHALARRLDADLERATALLTQLAYDLQRETPVWALLEKDAVALVELDARILLGDDADGLPPAERERVLSESRVRRNVIPDVSRSAYAFGKRRADRRDFRGACLAWKTGSRFSRSDLDLLKALTNVCTPKAASVFDSASSCEDLAHALDLAVDGDGYRERIADERSRLGCR